MPHLTTCSKCGRTYEESSEERANAPTWTGDRLCPTCWSEEHGTGRQPAQDDLLDARYRDPRYRDPFADVPARHVMRDALSRVIRAAEQFQKVIPEGVISQRDAVDLIADADELAQQLYRLTRAQPRPQDDKP
jgi:hypothetical protein